MSAQLHGARDLAAVAEALELGMASAEGAWESVAQRPQPHAVAGPEAEILLGLLGGLRTLLGATDDQPVRAVGFGHRCRDHLSWRRSPPTQAAIRTGRGDDYDGGRAASALRGLGG